MSSKIMFDRKWQLILETFEKDGSNNLTPLRKKTLGSTVNFTASGDSAKTAVDLKVMFNIRNTLLGDPSLASFQIYNINSKTKSFLTDNRCFITFKSGYYSDNSDDLGVLFQGEITNAYEIRQGTDSVWNVWARDAFNLLEYTFPTLQPIQNEVSPKSVLEKLQKDATGISTITYVNTAESKIDRAENLDEYTHDGTFKKEFSDILDPLGLGWKIIGDELIVYDGEFIDPATTEENAILVNNQTGLLSVPTVDYTGVSFTSLLNPDFKPSKVINVEPNTARYNLGNEFYVEKFDKNQWRANGRFRIYEATHKGDTRGDRWETEVIAFYRRN